MLTRTIGVNRWLTDREPQRVENKTDNGWILYDGRCAICRRGARFWGRTLKSRGYVLTPLQRRWVGQRLKMSRAELMEQVWLLRPGGQLFGGADAVVAVARTVWWAAPLVWISGVRGAMPLLRRIYRVIARNRYCTGGKCELRRAGTARQRGLSGFWEI